jgi:hypothetical protein
MNRKLTPPIRAGNPRPGHEKDGMRSLKSLTTAKVGRIAVTAALVTACLATLSESSQAATGAGLTPSSGGALTAQVLSLTGGGFSDAAGTSKVLAPGGTTFGVSFTSAASCASDAAAGHAAGQIDATQISIASSNRLIISVPGTGGLADTVGSNNVETKKDYQLCVYAATATNGVNKLMTSAKYSVYPRPTLAASNYLSLTSGPSTGGQAITVIGDTSGSSSTSTSGYYSAKTTAALGGVTLANLKVAKDGNSFTAVTPALPSGPATLVVTTEGGSVTQTAAYTAVNSIVVSPSLVSPPGGTVVTVKGKGFFGVKDAAGFGIAFYAGDYSTSNPGTPCTSVQVISDTELVCASPLLNAGAYNVIVTDDLTGSTPTYASVVSSGATVTAGGF